MSDNVTQNVSGNVSENVLTAAEVAAMRERARPQFHNPWYVEGVDHPDAAFIAAQHASIDRLTAQVVALRELCKQLPSYCPCRAIQGLADGESIREHNAHCATTLKERVLADTEAAAREHDRKLRLEGAREFVAFGGSLVDWEASGCQTFKEWQADMEADQP